MTQFDGDKSVSGWLQLLVIALIVMGAFILAGVLKLTYKQDPLVIEQGNEMPWVQSLTVQPRQQSIQWQTTGTVQARNQVGIIPRVGGRVEWVNPAVHAGSRFSADEILFKLSTRTLKAQMREAQAMVERVQADLVLQRSRSKAAREEWKILHPGKAVPDLVAQLPQLQQAKANLKSAKARLDTMKINLGRKDYRLPFAGRIVRSSIEKGLVVQAGQSYGAAYDMDSLEIVVPIEAHRLHYFDKDKTIVEVMVSVQGRKQVFAARIDRVAEVLDEGSRMSRLFLVPSETAQRFILPGMFVELNFSLPEQQDLLALPINVLQEQGHIWRIDAQDQLSRYQPDIVMETGEVVYLRAKEALQVVVGKNPDLISGMTVRIQQQNGVAEDE